MLVSAVKGRCCSSRWRLAEHCSGIATAVQAAIPDSQGVVPRSVTRRRTGRLRVVRRGRLPSERDGARLEPARRGRPAGRSWPARRRPGRKVPQARKARPGPQGPNGANRARTGSPGADGQNVTGTTLASRGFPLPERRLVVHCRQRHVPTLATVPRAAEAEGSAPGLPDGGNRPGAIRVRGQRRHLADDSKRRSSCRLPRDGADERTTHRRTPGGGQSTLATCFLLDGSFPLDFDNASVSLPKDVMIPGTPPVPGTIAGHQTASMTLVSNDGLTAGSVLHVRCDGIVLGGTNLTATSKIAVIKAG